MAYGAGKRKRSSQDSQGGTKRRMFKKAIAGPVPRPLYAKPELKAFDITTGLIDIPSTGVFSELCIPVLGNDFNNRIGRKIVNKSFYLRYYVGIKEAFGMVTANSIAPGHCRLIVFVDYQPNAAVPAVSDLLNASTTISQVNLNNRDRFKILRDITHDFDAFNLLAADASPAWNRTMQSNEVYMKINIETIFNGNNAGNVGDITSGCIYTLWLGFNPLGGTHHQMSMTTRVRYVDN